MTGIPTRDEVPQVSRRPTGRPQRPGPMAGGPAMDGGRLGGAAELLGALRVLRRRKGLIIGSTVACLAVATLGSLIWLSYAPTYTAVAQMQVNPPKGSMVDQPRAFSYSRDVIERLAIQAARGVASHEVLSAVVRDEVVRGTVWFKRGREDDAVERLRQAIEATVVDKTRLIEVSVTAIARSKEEREQLAQIVNTVAREAEKDSLNTSNKALTNQLAALTKQKGILESELRKNSEALEELIKKGEPIGILKDRREAMSFRLKAYGERQVQLEIEKERAQVGFDMVTGPDAERLLVGSAEVMVALESDANLASLRHSKVTWQTELENILLQVGPEHRDVKAVQGRINSLERKTADREQQIISERIQAMKLARRRHLDDIMADLEDTEKKYKMADEDARKLEVALEQREKILADKAYLTDSLRALEARRTDLRMLREEERQLSLIREAVRPTSPSRPKPIYWIPSGLLIGLAVGLALAFVLELLDTSIKAPSDVVRRVGLPVLGAVPHAGDLDEDVEPLHRAFANQPRSLFSEAIRQIRAALIYGGPENERRSLLLTSAMPQDGRTVVALNLAAAIASFGRKVLVVDVNLRQPKIHQLFPDVPLPGLSGALTEPYPWESLALAVGGNLSVMAAGPVPAKPTELLGSEKMRRLIEEMTAKYDHVLFDGAPCLLVSDAGVLGRMVDGVLLVVRAGTSTPGMVNRARDVLASVGARVLGVILTGVRATAGGYLRKNYERFYAYQEEGPGFDDEARPADQPAGQPPAET